MPPANREQRVVVVLGMHRSGTSVITRALQPLGVSLGERFLPAAADNPKGFWEDAEINALNVDLLEALGHDWHTLTPIRQDELAAPMVKEFKLRALAILRERLSLTDCFGMKDPRIARLLIFWQEVFAHLQISACYVIVCRNPLSVARSLAKRNGFDLEKGYYLWLEHVLESLVRTENQKRIVVDYDLFLDDPVKHLRKIAQALGLSFDPSNPKVTEFVSGFVEYSLRHTHYQVEDLCLARNLPPSAVELYQATLELGADTLALESPGFRSRLGNLVSRQRDLDPALSYMQVCEQKVEAALRLAAERGREISKLNQALCTHQSQQAMLQNEISHLKVQLSGIQASRAWKLARLLRVLWTPFRNRTSASAHS